MIKNIWLSSLLIILSLCSSCSTQATQENKATTTYFDPANYTIAVQEYWSGEARNLDQLIKASTIIVRGRVLQILGTVETEDAELLRPGFSPLHTDVLFEVTEYLGPHTLPYRQLVIRHGGGRLGKLCHVITGQEHLRVGEEVLVFQLWQPPNLTQVPEGYDPAQYYVFTPHSKFKQLAGGAFQPDFDGGSMFFLGKLQNKLAKPSP